MRAEPKSHGNAALPAGSSGGQMPIERQRGFALIAVLWAALIFAAIAASLIATGRSQTHLARTHYTLAQLNAAADAGINIAILRMLDSFTAQHIPIDATPFTVEFAGHRIAIAVQDEAGKIDLNKALDKTLRQLLTAAGLDARSSRSLTDKILDWREAGIARRPDGAKAGEYRDAGMAYGPRNGPFQSVEELLLVLGLNTSLYARIAPSLTVYSQTPWIDPASAPPDVLSALAALGGPPVASVLAERKAGTAGGVILGHAFTVSARIEDADGFTAVRTAVIRLTGTARAPLSIYRWY